LRLNAVTQLRGNHDMSLSVPGHIDLIVTMSSRALLDFSPAQDPKPQSVAQ